MYLNLYREMRKLGIRQKDIAETLKITNRTTNKKLVGVSYFTSKEMFTIRDNFFPQQTLDYLFAIEQQQ